MEMFTFQAVQLEYTYCHHFNMEEKCLKLLDNSIE